MDRTAVVLENNRLVLQHTWPYAPQSLLDTLRIVTASAIAIYSTSVRNHGIVVCVVWNRMIAPPQNMIPEPGVDRLALWGACRESVDASSLPGTSLQKAIPSSV